MNKHTGLLISILLLITSCTTYYMTTDSLRSQCSLTDSTKLKMVTVSGPIGERYNYLANPIDKIECFDKNGNPSQLVNSPSIEIRITEKNKEKAIFYFDRIFVTDSTLTGIQSRFISFITKTIKLENIKKIEIQDGKKNFNYVSK